MQSPLPVILEVALNGATPPDRNPNVPRTPTEVAADGLRCLEAGAAIVHNHTDDRSFDGVTRSHDPQPYREAWRAILDARPDALLYPTMTGGGPHTTIEERYGHVEALGREGLAGLGLVDPGSVNLGFLERDGTPDASPIVYENSNADVRHMMDVCARLELPISFSIFDGSFMRTAVAYARAGRVRHGGILKIYFGGPRASFGLPPTRAALLAYLDLMGDCGLPFSVAVLGGDVLETPVAREALERGGHLRVGLEDYAGTDQPSNALLIERARTLCDEVGRPMASASEARRILQGGTRSD